MLPGMNGFRVCSALREAGHWTPILMLTAKDGELDEAEALDTGADDFLTKPFSFVVLDGPAPGPAAPRGAGPARPCSTAGDLRLDPASHLAWRGDDELNLTAREFALLEFLMRQGRPGHVEDRDPRARLGPGLRRRLQHRRGVRGLPPAQGRRALRPPGDPDGAGRGISPRPRWRLVGSTSLSQPVRPPGSDPAPPPAAAAAAVVPGVRPGPYHGPVDAGGRRRSGPAPSTWW